MELQEKMNEEERKMYRIWKREEKLKLLARAHGAWKAMYEKGDAELIAKRYGYSNTIIRKAIVTGDASLNVLLAVNQFYKTRFENEKQKKKYYDHQGE